MLQEKKAKFDGTDSLRRTEKKGGIKNRGGKKRISARAWLREACGLRKRASNAKGGKRGCNQSYAQNHGKRGEKGDRDFEGKNAYRKLSQCFPLYKKRKKVEFES